MPLSEWRKKSTTVPSNPHTAVMVVGHGTTSLEGISQFEQIVDQLRKCLEVPVGHGFIELAEPDIATGFSRLLASNDISEVVVLPLLLLAAGHAKNDVPSSISAARKRYPRVSFSYAKDLSVTPTLLEIVEDRTLTPFEVVPQATLPPFQAGFTLLVGRGSTDPDANSDLYKIARLLTERGELGLVEPAFISLAKPSVAEALDRLRLLGARNVTVSPYFLFTGSLLERIYVQSRSWARQNPDITLRLAKEMGPDQRIVDLLIQRVGETDSPVPVMNCDMCIYRAEIPGHEHKVGQPHSFTDLHQH
ncbi:MAG: sirohydrochlorin chelatase [Actinomycetota bacterium]|nr:sirohydrochlorin chelatase [Actinomycetota bacterium]